MLKTVQTVIGGGGNGGGNGLSMVVTLTATENIAAGAMVNVWNSSGAKVRNANAADNTKPCHAFVLSSIANGASGSVYFSGILNTSLANLTIGSFYYLDTNAGAVNVIAPASAGNAVQQLGVAVASTTLAFYPLGVTTL
jgi:hypothetical protein